MTMLDSNATNKVNSNEMKASLIISQGFILTYFHIFTNVSKEIL